MKKLLAVLLAAVFFLSSMIPAFAVAVSYTSEEIVSNFHFRDLGEGKFSVPVDFSMDSELANKNFSRDSAAWKEFFRRYDSGEYTLCFVSSPNWVNRPYLYLFCVEDISSFSVFRTQTYHTNSNNSSHYDFHYYVRSSETIPYLQLFYDDKLDVYLPMNAVQCSANSNFFKSGYQYSSSCDAYKNGFTGIRYSFSFFSPSFDNSYSSYIKFLDFESLTLCDGHSDLYTLTINYLYSENNPAADSIAQEVAPGAEYSIPSPEVEGYTPSIPIVTGTMPDGDLTIDVYYSKTFHSLTVKYQYADGSTVSPDVVFQYPPGFVYDVLSPEVEGYRADKLSVSGTMGNEPLEVVVTYSPIPYTLTVNYRYADGSTAAESHQEQLFIGASYSIPSPVIEGFHPNQTAVTGIMPARDVISTVTYRDDPGGSGGPGPAGPGEGGGPGEGEGGNTGGEGGSGNDPFIPVLPPYSGNDPFIVPSVPGYSGNDPFVVPRMPGYSGYDPFIVRPPPAFYGYDPFKMPEGGGS